MSQEQSEMFDAIVIGAGQAGGPLASALANSGLRTAIIEREHVGGTCVNVGCTPSKTLVASAHVAHVVRRDVDYGVHSSPPEIDMVEVRQRKRDIVESFRAGSERRLKETQGLELIRGEASFSGPKQIRIQTTDGGERRLMSGLIFINTGARPAMPPLPGLADVPALDSTSIMELDCVPDHLLVVGGGYVGLEFSQMFRRFGSEVTIVQRGSQLLSHEDPDIAEAVADILREDGINILLDTSAKSVARDKDGGIALTVTSSDGEHVLSGSHLLLATGRTPNTDHLNLAAAGVTTNERGYVPVNERLETDVPGIYALGDVNGGPAFTHMSYDDFRVIRTNLLQGGNATTTARLVPYTIYIDPQLGRVGTTEQEARAAGRSIRVAKMPMSHVARAIQTGQTRGVMKIIVDGGTDQILGCAILGMDGGELMSMVEIAMMGRVPYTALRDGIFAHPTLAESLNNVFGHLSE